MWYLSFCQSTDDNNELIIIIYAQEILDLVITQTYSYTYILLKLYQIHY